MGKKQDELREKTGIVFKKLFKLYPDAHCELDFSTPFELLVATILSAQCTDVRVNLVTKDLFTRYKKPQDFLDLGEKKLCELIHSTGFYRNKAKSIIGASKEILSNHSGKVPKTRDELVTLPGVGRKTANVVLSNAFDLPGLPVDTHVTRLSNRLGLSKNTDAVKIEFDLMELLEPAKWGLFSLLLIFHGRRICKARTPLCSQCSLTEHCLYFKKNYAKENLLSRVKKNKKEILEWV
jgi:endonuclease III